MSARGRHGCLRHLEVFALLFASDIIAGMFKLNDKVAVITGAGSGIGEAIARTFAKAGAEVYVLDRDAANGRRVAEAIESEGGRGDFIETDVASEDSCNIAASFVHDVHGRGDVLVNNAGIGHVGTVMTTKGEDLDRLYAVNVKGVHNVSRAFLPGMVERRWGSVVNLASIGGIVAVRDRYAYCMTKFAV